MLEAEPEREWERTAFAELERAWEMEGRRDSVGVNVIGELRAE
jgi:hypothetical protein